MARRRPAKNVDARDFMAFIDEHLTRPVDLDGVQRTYINGIWVDDVRKRELRRYRHGQVASLRPTTVTSIIETFNLTQEYSEWQAARQ